MKHVLLIVAAVAAAGPGQESKIETGKGDLVIHPVSHATFVMTWAKKTIYVDPVGGGAAFRDFGKPDLILLTDIHGDHLDADTLSAVSTDRTTLIAPKAVLSEIPKSVPGKRIEIANGGSTEWAGSKIEAVAMYNLTEERKKFHPKGRGNGYVLTLGKKRIYISGDTEDIPEMRRLKDIDAAFVCMNLPYTMTVERAADAVLEFKPKVVFPYHYRGKGGMSDVAEFKKLVAKDPSIEVRLLKWYP